MCNIKNLICECFNDVKFVTKIVLITPGNTEKYGVKFIHINIPFSLHEQFIMDISLDDYWKQFNPSGRGRGNIRGRGRGFARGGGRTITSGNVFKQKVYLIIYFFLKICLIIFYDGTTHLSHYGDTCYITQSKLMIDIYNLTGNDHLS